MAQFLIWEPFRDHQATILCEQFERTGIWGWNWSSKDLCIKLPWNSNFWKSWVSLYIETEFSHTPPEKRYKKSKKQVLPCQGPWTCWCMAEQLRLRVPPKSIGLPVTCYKPKEQRWKSVTTITLCKKNNIPHGSKPPLDKSCLFQHPNHDFLYIMTSDVVDQPRARLENTCGGADFQRWLKSFFSDSSEISAMAVPCGTVQENFWQWPRWRG